MAKTTESFTRVEMEALASRASSLYQRLSGIYQPEQNSYPRSSRAERKLHQWNESIGLDDEAFVRRLNWLGLDRRSMKPYLGEVSLKDGLELPGWVKRLDELRTSMDQLNDQELFQHSNSREEYPYEDAFYPMVSFAYQWMESRVSPESFRGFSGNAIDELKEQLLKRLSDYCAKVLHRHFLDRRSPDPESNGNAGPFTSGPNRQYKRFVRSLRQGRWVEFWSEYPVMARNIVCILQQWVLTNSKLFRRFHRDCSLLSQLSGLEKEPDRVESIEAPQIDRHNRGRSVRVLTFKSGTKVVYKPRSVAPENFLARMVDFLGNRSSPIDFKVPDALSQDSYGWVQFVEQRPCNTENGVKRFYERLGALTAFAAALNGDDLQHQNLIADGEHPVLIDPETLLTPTIGSEDDLPKSTDSVLSLLRTGILPHLRVSGSNFCIDVSATGGEPGQSTGYPRDEWNYVNTDRMKVTTGNYSLPGAKNLPYRASANYESIENYVEAYQGGFEKYYRFLNNTIDKDFIDQNRDGFRSDTFRVLVRNTSRYLECLWRGNKPENLKSGIARSIQYDRLARRCLLNDGDVYGPELLRSEHRQLDRLDVPIFRTSPSDSSVHGPDYGSNGSFEEDSSIASGQISISLPRSGVERIRDNIESLDESDLERKSDLIRRSIVARERNNSPFMTTDRKSKSSVGNAGGDSFGFLKRAQQIADLIQAKALDDDNPSWADLVLHPESSCHQVRVLDRTLGTGTGGILAYLTLLESKVDLNPSLRDFSTRLRTNFRNEVKSRDFTTVSHGFMGDASTAYVLSLVGKMIKNNSFLRIATKLLGNLRVPDVRDHARLDFQAGLSGSLLSLVSTYEFTESDLLRTKAINCGDRIISDQRSFQDQFQGWSTVGNRTWSGVLRGQSGIGWALVRLFEITGKERFLEAARDGFSYERFLIEERPEPPGEVRYRRGHTKSGFESGWCHGWAGSLLVRLGCLQRFDSKDVKADVEFLVNRILENPPVSTDTIGCGETGIALALSRAGYVLDRSSWRDEASERLKRVEANARKQNGYRSVPGLFPEDPPPGLINGLAGLGYANFCFDRNDMPRLLLMN